MARRPNRPPQRFRRRTTRASAAAGALPRLLACTLTPGLRYADVAMSPDADGYALGRLAIADDGRPLAWLRRREPVTSGAGRRFLWLDLFAN